MWEFIYFLFLKLLLSILAISRISSVNRYSLCEFRSNGSKYFLKFSGKLLTISRYPTIDWTGVRNSCAAIFMNSFYIISCLLSSSFNCFKDILECCNALVFLQAFGCINPSYAKNKGYSFL
jgi:hypothetical protein